MQAPIRRSAAPAYVPGGDPFKALTAPPTGPAVALVLGLALAAALSCASGCAAPRDSSKPSGSSLADPAPAPGLDPTVATLIDARPAALINGRSVSWGELRPFLSELGGAEALENVILDRRLADLAAETGVVVTTDDEQGEQRRLLETLSDDPNTAVRLLDELRASERLGPARYRALLRRNAHLRVLVRDDVEVREAAIVQMYDTLHGPRRQVRLLMTSDLAAARDVSVRLREGARFGDLAVALSTDTSASRGGLLEPVSRFDPSYPAALRQAIWALEAVGDVSPPTLLDGGYAIVQLDRAFEADDVPLADVRVRMERLARLARERLLMDQLATRLLADVNLTIFDDSLESAWRTRRRIARR